MIRTPATSLVVPLSIVLLVALASPLHAQRADSARVAAARDAFVLPAPPRVVTSVAALPPGSVLRVSSMGRRYQGRLVGIRGDTLALDDRDTVRAIPLGRVDTLWRRGTEAGPIGVLGAILGATLLGDMGGMGDGECGDPTWCTVKGAVAGATFGGVAFGMVGAAFKSWRRVEPPGPKWGWW